MTASRTIRWGVLGTGTIAQTFAATLRSLPHARLQAVGSRDLARAWTFADHCGVATAHGSYEALVRDADVDVVYVATPNSAHMAHCLLAIGQGKAVLCEKPFAMTAAEARVVVEAAQHRRVFCMEAMWPRFVPIMAELETRLQAGVIGELRMLVAHLGMAFAPDPQHRVFVPALGGGALMDLGIYPLSLASRLLGAPSRVTAHAVIGPTGVDEQVTMLLDYPAGAQAVLTASIRGPLPNDATITGTTGLMHLHAPLYCPETVSISRAAGTGPGTGSVWARGLASLAGRLRTTAITRRVQGNGYAHEALEVMRCLHAGILESPRMPLADTVAVMDTVDAVRHAWGHAGSHA